MTMFFTAGSSPPFEDLTDALRKGWNLYLLDHYINAQVESRATDDNPEFVELLHKYRESKSSVTVDDIAGGVRLLQTTPGVVFHNAEELMEEELSNLDDNHNIFSVGKKDVSKLGTLFAKNSPLKPMFDQGILRLRESGLLDSLYKKWWKKFKKNQMDKIRVISFYDTILAVVAFGVAVVVAAIVAFGQGVGDVIKQKDLRLRIGFKS